MPKRSKIRRRRRLRRGRRRGRVGRAFGRLPRTRASLPGAYQRRFKSSFRMNQTQSGMIVSGKDLVQPLPYNIAVNEQYNCFAAIPSNPCYWTGTRVAALASAYQNFRPLKIAFHYVPQVAVTTPGTVLCGTVWNTPTSVSSFEQSMVTSNGGQMSQCYVPFSSHVALGRNLPQRLFNCAGNLDVDHNPFFFLAMMRGSNVVPGYFFVSYVFELRNPLGYSVTYANTLTTAPNWGQPRPNRSAVILNQIPKFAGPGLVIDIEANGDVLYNGTAINVPEGTACIVYTNEPVSNLNTEITELPKSLFLTTDNVNNVVPGRSVESMANVTAWNWNTNRDLNQGTFMMGQSNRGGWSYEPLGGEFGDIANLTRWFDASAVKRELVLGEWDPDTSLVKDVIGVLRSDGAGTSIDPNMVFRVLQRAVSVVPPKPSTIEPDLPTEYRPPKPKTPVYVLAREEEEDETDDDEDSEEDKKDKRKRKK